MINYKDFKGLTEERAKELQGLTPVERDYVQALKEYYSETERIDRIVKNAQQNPEKQPGIELITPSDYDSIIDEFYGMLERGEDEEEGELALIRRAIASRVETLKKMNPS